MKISQDFRGLEEHMARISQMGVNVDDAADRALMAGAEPVHGKMLDLVPKDKGNLADNIKIDGPNRDGNVHTVEVGVIHKKGFADAETARYGNVQEFGSSSVAAQPYMRPAVQITNAIRRKRTVESLKNEGLI